MLHTTTVITNKLMPINNCLEHGGKSDIYQYPRAKQMRWQEEQGFLHSPCQGRQRPASPK